MLGVNILRKKTCCITGNTEVDHIKTETVKENLRHAIIEAIKQGYTHFICGFADGVDLYFAAIVAELKDEYHISLEAAIPYRNRIKATNAEFQRLLQHCNIIGVHSETYEKNCFLLRNRFMVQVASLVIAAYDGREIGDTLFTMRYAHAMETEVRVINI